MSRPWANFPDPDAFGVPLVAEQSSFTRSSVVTSSRACPRAPATRFTHQRATQLERRGGSSTSLDTSRFIGVSSVVQLPFDGAMNRCRRALERYDSTLTPVVRLVSVASVTSVVDSS